MTQARNERKILADRRLIESSLSPQTDLPQLRLRKERAARTHLDAAHLAGTAAVGGEPGGIAGDAAAGSGQPGRAPQAAGTDGGAGGGGAERRWGADEGGDPGRDLPLWGRENGGELARFRAEVREAFGGRAPRVLDPFAGAERFRWKRCGSGARRWRRTSTPWRGSSCVARSTIRACWPGRHGRCLRSRWTIGSWSRSS